MNKKGYYTVQFKGYPDVVTLQEMAEMLGGVCVSTASRLLQTNRVNAFKIKNKWQIPKLSIIEFMTSEDYDTFWKEIENAKCRTLPTDLERKQQKVLLFCEQPKSAKEIMLLLDLSSKKTLYRLYIRPLLESGKLQRTIPDQTCISTQKYVWVRKTHSGKY